MGGVQGWHLVLLGLGVVVVVAVILIVVLVVKAANKPRPDVGTGVGPDPQSQYPHAMATSPYQQQHGSSPQIGYSMDGQPLYGQPVVQRINDFAIMALILGLATGILGIIFGHIARSQIKKTGEGGSGLALAGLIIGYVWVGFTVVLVFSIFATATLTV